MRLFQDQRVISHISLSFAALYELSQLLNTGLDRQTLSVLAALCECGINPEALATAVKELSKQRPQ